MRSQVIRRSQWTNDKPDNDMLATWLPDDLEMVDTEIKRDRPSLQCCKLEATVLGIMVLLTKGGVRGDGS